MSHFFQRFFFPPGTFLVVSKKKNCSWIDTKTGFIIIFKFYQICREVKTVFQTAV